MLAGKSPSNNNNKDQQAQSSGASVSYSNALDVSISPTKDPGVRTKERAGRDGGNRECPISNEWLEQDVTKLSSVKDWFETARWFATQVEGVDGHIKFKLAIDEPSVIAQRKRGTSQETGDAADTGEREFRTKSLYSGKAFSLMMVSNVATWAVSALAITTRMQGGGLGDTPILASLSSFVGASPLLALSAVGVANLVVSMASTIALQTEVKDALNKPMDRALNAKAYCDKLAWTAALYHNILSINPLPSIPQIPLVDKFLKGVFRTDWTTLNWIESKDTFSVFWVVGRVRDAAKDAYAGCHKQKTMQDIDKFAGDKFFDDKLEEARDGMTTLSNRYLRLPNMATWAAMGPGAFGGVMLLKSLLFG
jgi:hypothetical protein